MILKEAVTLLGRPAINLSNSRFVNVLLDR